MSQPEEITMADKAEKKTVSGVVKRKRGINYNGEHYPHDTAITLPEHQFKDWLSVGIVGEASGAAAKNAKPVNNDRLSASPPEAAEPPKTI
jgi:hypothetical protein